MSENRCGCCSVSSSTSRLVNITQSEQTPFPQGPCVRGIFIYCRVIHPLSWPTNARVFVTSSKQKTNTLTTTNTSRLLSPNDDRNLIRSSNNNWHQHPLGLHIHHSSVNRNEFQFCCFFCYDHTQTREKKGLPPKRMILDTTFTIFYFIFIGVLSICVYECCRSVECNC